MSVSEKEEILLAIRQILDKSDLSAQDKEMWLRLLRGKPYFFGLLFLNIFEQNRELLPVMTQNVRTKIDALEDSSKLQEVWENEYQLLSSVIEQ